MTDFKENFTMLINNFWHENKEIIRLKDKIKDDEEKIKSHELNILRLSSCLSSEKYKPFLIYILQSDILDYFQNQT